MSVDVANLLRRSTSRAKSDVANKLVSMLLHEVSRQLCSNLGMAVNGVIYPKIVEDYFGRHCSYCKRELVARQLAVEHLDGMNRLRAGLHVPGNVIVACHECNHEKRRDDQLRELPSTSSGWASFLSHDTLGCMAGCKGCVYWAVRFPDLSERQQRLKESRFAIETFRALPEILPFSVASEVFRTTHGASLVEVYRRGQDFAQELIGSSVRSMAWDAGS
jgi:hypothetical protein